MLYIKLVRSLIIALTGLIGICLAETTGVDYAASRIIYPKDSTDLVRETHWRDNESILICLQGAAPMFLNIFSRHKKLGAFESAYWIQISIDSNGKTIKSVIHGKSRILFENELLGKIQNLRFTPTKKGRIEKISFYLGFYSIAHSNFVETENYSDKGSSNEKSRFGKYLYSGPFR